MSLDQSQDRASLETPRQSIDYPPAVETTNAQKPGEVVSPTRPDAGLRERVDNVLQSDIGISTLLNRLKQSISSAREFANFLKERSVLEERHSAGIKKLSQNTAELIRKPDNRQGSFAQNYFEITRVHDRIADHGLVFAIDLHNMSDELLDLTSNMERGRKHWKQTGLNAEKRVQEAEAAMEKSKSKYDSLADQYERVRTGEKQGGKFGLKGPKSSAQQEEDLLRKVQAADADYAQKVHSAQTQRNELLSMQRPQAVKALYDLIAESDLGLSSQMQKFAALNERLLLSSGLCVNPLRSEASGAGPQPRSLREIAQGVNNDRDFQEYVLSFSNKAGTKPSELRYEKHPSLVSPKHTQNPQFPPPQNFNSSQPQFGHPIQSNTGLGVGFDQGQRPGQMTGVTPAPYQNRDGQQVPGPYNYNSHMGGPQQSPPSQYGNAPQLPPVNLSDSKSGGVGNNYGPDPNQRPDLVSPPNSNDYRSVSSPLNQNKPLQLMGTSDNAFRPANGPLNQNRTVSQPGYQGQNNYPPANPVGPGGHQSNIPLAAGALAGGALAGTAFAANRNDGYGGGQPTNPAMRQNDGSAMQNNNYRPETKSPPMGQNSYGQEQRGLPPSMSNNYPPDSRAPPPGQGGNYAPDPRVQQPVLAPQQYDQRAQPLDSNIQPQSQRQHTGPSNSINSLSNAPSAPVQPRRAEVQRANLLPLNPVFGVSLEELYIREKSAVPTIVYQCIQAVDLFGLNTEGIYRTSGSAINIIEMKSKFDHDSSKVDFLYQDNFHNDIPSVTTLLKHFLRDLPDPLLTSERYNSFIQAAKIDDEIVRRDSLHAIVNALPDPHYATLRVLMLHLNRVAEHSEKNRMTASNLAICFGPTLMGSGGNGVGGGDIRDAGWQARVVETILNNTMQIFDDDE